MDRVEYEQWSGRYAATFGMGSDADAAMFAAWFDVFGMCGYSLAELTSARLSVARDPPKFRSEHLPAIHAAIRTARLAEHRRRWSEPAEGEIGVCADCGDTGVIAGVPHPKFVLAGKWSAGFAGYRPTAGVLCHCLKGQAWMETYDRRPDEYHQRVKRPMGYAEYVQIVPRWRELLANREAEDAAGRRAVDAASHADKYGGPLAAVMKRLAARAGRATQQAGATPP